VSPRQTSAEILVGVDCSPSSVAAVEWAARDAAVHEAPLRLVHVAPVITEFFGPVPPAPPPGEYASWQEQHAHQILEEAHKLAAEAAQPHGAYQITSDVLYDAPILPTLVDLTKQAQMVVVGCRGQTAVARTLLGSVSSGLVYHAKCPVAVIHDEDSLAAVSPHAPVVVGVDGSPASDLATEIAFDEASRRGVGVVALHAWSDVGALGFGRPGQAPVEWANFEVREEQVLAERLAEWQQRYPDVSVSKIVVSDRPAPRLLQQAETAQLVVVGSRGRGGFSGMLLGSVGRAVVNAARIPVIVARSNE
jgi:nucleotide-binding universal stress UspA family protein